MHTVGVEDKSLILKFVINKKPRIARIILKFVIKKGVKENHVPFTPFYTHLIPFSYTGISVLTFFEPMRA